MTKKSNLRVSAIIDYIVEIEGKYDFSQNSWFTNKEGDVSLYLLQANEDKAYCISNDELHKINIGDEVFEKEKDIITESKFFNSIIDIYGNVLTTNATSKNKSKELQSGSTLYGKFIPLTEYKPIDTQLKTGYLIIDLITPIGLGQRQLIIGDRKTGKTHLALNTIINQANKNIKCIYVAIGQNKNSVSEVYQTLINSDVMKNTIIIHASASNPYEQYLAPYIGMLHAENISKEDDVLIVFDDLTTHANIFREIALLTNKPVGKEAYPGDMFFAHSRLLERSGNFKNRKSITALPIVQTIDGDITSAIASNIISITDGQIVTSSKQFDLGKRPAIDIDLSVSRVGASAQSKSMAKLAKQIAKLYKAYRRQIKLANINYSLNEEANNLMNNGQIIEKMFNQPNIAKYDEKSVFIFSKLLIWNILSKIDTPELSCLIITKLIDQDNQSKDLYEALKNNKDVDENMIKNYFAFMLKEVANKLALNWNIKVENEFIKPEDKLINNIIAELGDK
ncbi:ATP F0F1 synthase subunit alpha [[Mycoplasma] falconis]|uniref:ATP F0F1 synthase subunit alpha n=1 Tax=[Mycoplasma] falconis TaxID=92403 RepID=A0A501XA10_9BACT|nr:ATP F0F1 synthase subunit alpha [[Mycoplasma] falconis]TPE57269.1 ATP F0F1 synthase subunit alpha [[Mycoplasma] falconis]